MTVKELIEHLQELGQDAIVFTAMDDEGNGYNEVYFDPGEWFYTQDGREVDIYPTTVPELMEHFDCDEEEAKEYLAEGEICVVI